VWRHLPADFLRVVIHADGEPLTTTQATAAQHLTPVRGCHPSAKTVDANTAANFGLVCPFGHIIFLSLILH
jgi:hypothetical protein